jgi:hypothetical protein
LSRPGIGIALGRQIFQKLNLDSPLRRRLGGFVHPDDNVSTGHDNPIGDDHSGPARYVIDKDFNDRTFLWSINRHD